MGLRLCNGYPARIWTAIMFYSPETCGGEGGNFEAMGWWSIEPNACANVYANDVGDLNRFWYIYADADDGAVWAGPFAFSAPLDAFGGDQACWGVQASSDHHVGIGFRQIDVGDSDDHIVTFVP
jgi:uncharacterized membrane protein